MLAEARLGPRPVPTRFPEVSLLTRPSRPEVVVKTGKA